MRIKIVKTTNKRIRWEKDNPILTRSIIEEYIDAINKMCMIRKPLANHHDPETEERLIEPEIIGES